QHHPRRGHVAPLQEPVDDRHRGPHLLLLLVLRLKGHAMAGFQVTPELLNARAGEAAQLLSRALGRVEQLKLWLDDHPGYVAESFLVTEFGLTSQEAYLLHSVFADLATIRTTHAAALALARKLTGLE